MAGLDRREFRTLFDESRETIFRYALRLCRHRSDAEDLLQEVYLTVWRKRRQFRGNGSAVGYLRKTTYHLYINGYTKRTRRRRLAERAPPEHKNGRASAPAVDGLVARAEGRIVLHRRVDDALDRMPARAREAFVMHRLEGLAVREIAHITETPIKTIESRIARATHLLALALEPHREDLPTP